MVFEYTSLNEDGEWSYDGFVSERTVDVYNKVVSMWKNDAFYFGESMDEEDYTINTESANAQSAFMNDDLLFFGGQLRSTEQFRDMKGDFTIIPFPKYDEEQEDYVSGNFGVCYFAIPLSVKDPKCPPQYLRLSTPKATARWFLPTMRTRSKSNTPETAAKQPKCLISSQSVYASISAWLTTLHLAVSKAFLRFNCTTVMSL